VILTGTARVVEEKTRKRIILQKIIEKYQPEGGYREVSIKDTKMVAIIEVEIRTFSEKDHLRE
jgi:nitroimidazol reductase NimA-like FMN-containing flavoprotein (pyridoxamine 5'-phosphate oxidase superfamily)